MTFNRDFQGSARLPRQHNTNADTAHDPDAGVDLRIRDHGVKAAAKLLKTNLLADDDSRLRLLHGRTALDLLRAIGGRISELEVSVYQIPESVFARDPRTASPKWDSFYRAIGVDDGTIIPGTVRLKLQITPDLQTNLDYHICIRDLLASTYMSGEWYIYNCECGFPECIGLYKGVFVSIEDELLVWWLAGSRPRRLAVFSHEKYQREVLAKVRTAVELFKSQQILGNFSLREECEDVEAALREAEKHIIS